MNELTNNAMSALDLCRLLESVLERETVSPEADYRIRKLIMRTRPMKDKMFLKTVKGRELILVCIELTNALQDAVRSGRQGVYRQLTVLENAYDELLRRTYEFRVKAG